MGTHEFATPSPASPLPAPPALTLSEAADIVAAHQRWRRGEVDQQEHSHRVIGRALDVLLDHARGAL